MVIRHRLQLFVLLAIIGHLFCLLGIEGVAAAPTARPPDSRLAQRGHWPFILPWDRHKHHHNHKSATRQPENTVGLDAGKAPGRVGDGPVTHSLVLNDTKQPGISMNRSFSGHVIHKEQPSSHFAKRKDVQFTPEQEKQIADLTKILAGPFNATEMQEINNVPEAEREAKASNVIDRKVRFAIGNFTNAEKNAILVQFPDQEEEKIFLEAFPEFLPDGTDGKKVIPEDQMRPEPLAVLNAFRDWKEDDSYIIPHEEDHVALTKLPHQGFRSAGSKLIRHLFRLIKKIVKFASRQGAKGWRKIRRVKKKKAMDMAEEDAYIDVAKQHDAVYGKANKGKGRLEEHSSPFEQGLTKAQREAHLKQLDEALKGRPGTKKWSQEERHAYHKMRIQFADWLREGGPERLPHMIYDKNNKLMEKAMRKEWREAIKADQKPKKWHLLKHNTHEKGLKLGPKQHKVDQKWHKEINDEFRDMGLPVSLKSSKASSGKSFCSSYSSLCYCPTCSGSSGVSSLGGGSSGGGSSGGGSVGSGSSGIGSVGSGSSGLGSEGSTGTVLHVTIPKSAKSAKAGDANATSESPQAGHANATSELPPPEPKAKPYEEIGKELDRLVSASEKVELQDWAKAHQWQGMDLLKKIANTEGYEFELHLCARHKGCVKPKKLLKVLKKFQKHVANRPKEMDA